MAEIAGGIRRGLARCAVAALALLPLLRAPASLAQSGNAMDELVKAAKAEGQVTFYATVTENVCRRLAEAFNAKYGIKADFIRFAGTTAKIRFATEAEGGKFPSDLLFIGSAVDFAEMGVKKGWFEPVSNAKLPVVASGTFPTRFNLGNIAVVQVTPWLLAYNTDKIKAEDVPKTWPELLNKKFVGQILVPDPRSSDNYLDFWGLLADTYGQSYFEELRALKPRHAASGAPAMQSLAAGEGGIEVPAVTALVMASKDKGAPLGMSVIGNTTGVEIQVLLTARDKAAHPNAARLMADYVMSPEGNAVFNSDPGGIVVYDISQLPKDYQPPKPGTVARKDEITKLLGFE